MSNLAVLSLKNRALIALVTIVAAVFGGLALTNLKQELIPSIEFPALSVIASYPGASPDVVANDVSAPIESAIQGVPGLESTSATSTTNASIIQASFEYGTDLATAEQKISQAINRIKGQLPESVDPQVFSLSIDDLPVIQLAVTGYDDEAAVQELLEQAVIPDLEDVDGVNSAEVIGGAGQRITITPDQEALAAAGFTQQAISDALEQNGVLFPGGGITEGDQTLTVQTGAKISSIEEIGQLPLVPTDAAQFGAETVTIADVATVAEETDPQTSISRVDGQPALTIAVTKLPAANTVDVSTGVLAVLPDLEDALDGQAEFTVVFDQAPYIQQSIEALAQEGLLGLAFAVLVILLFLMSVRSTLVTAISIPTSVLITFIGIQAFGYSLNILTLGALTIAIGRVVDDSIVVIENIKRHYVGTADKLRSILLAVREVAAAITASTITTVAVFLPIAFVGDMTGELFRPFALTVTIAMTASLLVSLTIVPVLAYWFLRPGKPLLDADGNQVDPEDPAAPPSRLQKAYLPVLRWTLKHSWITLLLAVLVLAGTVAAAPFMKTNFLGDTGQNTFTMTQDLGPAASLEAKDAAAQTVEDALLEVDGIETVQVSIGSSGSALVDAFSGGSSGATFSVTTDPDADQLVVREDVLDVVTGLEGVGDVAISATGGFGSSDIEIDVTAPDQQTLQEATDAVVTAIDGQDGVEQVTTNLSDALPYIAVVVDRDAAAALGLSEVAVGALVSSTMQPQQLGTVEIDDTALTVYLAASQTPATLEELRNLQVPSATGPVALSEIASVEESQGPTSITTEGGQRTATVSVTPSGDDLTTASAVVTEALAEADLPAAADATLGGVVSQQEDAFTQLGLAMLAAILIVYIVMVATFKSLRQPLLLLVSVPFAATGAILLQIVTGVPLGVASLIGVLMLIGIVVTNAIVLVDLVNQYRVKGLTAHDATIAGGARRLRPILMTALATIFALTPMAIGITGHGGFISQPLAIVVIGGLISSTVLTLLVLPTLYNLVEGARERRQAKRGALTPAVAGGPALAGTEPATTTASVPLTRRDRRAQAAMMSLPVVIPDAVDTRQAAASDAAPVAVAEPAAEEPVVAETAVEEPAVADPDDDALSALAQAVQPARVGDDTQWAQPEAQQAEEPTVEAPAEAEGDVPAAEADEDAETVSEAEAEPEAQAAEDPDAVTESVVADEPTAENDEVEVAVAGEPDADTDADDADADDADADDAGSRDDAAPIAGNDQTPSASDEEPERREDDGRD